MYGMTSEGLPKWNWRYSSTARRVSYVAGPPPAPAPVAAVLIAARSSSLPRGVPGLDLPRLRRLALMQNGLAQ